MNMNTKTIDVLLVDDDAADRRLVKLALAKSSGEIKFNIQTADTLYEAIEFLGKGDYDVTLLDLGLPDSSGIDTVKNAHKANPGTAIIILTGLDDEQIGIEAIKCGAEDYVVKGGNLDQILVRTIRYAIERKKTETKLKQTAEEWKSTFNSITDMVSIHDKDFKIVRANKWFADTLNMKPDEIVGKTCYKLIHGSNEPPSFCPHKRTLDTGKPNCVEFFEANLGIHVETSVSPIFGEDGCIIATVHIAKDISMRKQAEKLLKQAKKHAEAANEAKSQFLSNMSHEIRTPMNAVMGFCDLLADEELSDRQRDYVNTIYNSGKHLLQIINDILDFSKIEAGKLDVEMSECSLRSLLAVIESMIYPLAAVKNLKFEIQEDVGLPAYIHTDGARLQQCLINLVNNAVKFTKQGHVYLKVTMEDKNGKPYIHFDVEDTGIGIPKDRQKAIFESFTQADGSTSRKYGGTGLGLAITKRLSKLLGGYLTLISEEEKGSVFSLVIPAGLDVTKQAFLDRHNTAGQMDIDKEKTERTNFTGHVLVAEDVETNQMLVKLLLKRMGLEVTIAADGKQAVQKVLAQDFDLILMDIQMPNMNGYEATKALRKKGVKTPIIALTAHAMKGDDQKCIEAGCDDYLTKPLDSRQLLEKIAKYLPSRSEDLGKTVDSAKSKVDELTNLCPSRTAQDNGTEQRPCTEVTEEIIDWGLLIGRLEDEDLINEIVPIFLDDSREQFNKLSEAVNASDTKSTMFYAHAIKGAARNIGAIRLSDIAYQMEHAGRKNDIDTAARLLDSLKTELEKTLAFLSKPDWIETAKKQNAETPIIG